MKKRYQNTCRCGAYAFPHRYLGGKCRDFCEPPQWQQDFEVLNGRVWNPLRDPQPSKYAD